MFSCVYIIDHGYLPRTPYVSGISYSRDLNMPYHQIFRMFRIQDMFSRKEPPRFHKFRDEKSLRIDLSACGEENGPDDVEESVEAAWSCARTIVTRELPRIRVIPARHYMQIGPFRLELPGYVPTSFWVQQLPIDHELQDTSYLKTVSRYGDHRSMSDELWGAINGCEKSGLDEDLIGGQCPLINAL